MKAKKPRVIQRGQRFTIRLPDDIVKGSATASAQVTRILARHKAMLLVQPIETVFSPGELAMAWAALQDWRTDPPELIFLTAALTAKSSGKASVAFERKLAALKASELLVLANWIDARRGSKKR
jgi:hypothetical protein